MVKEWKAVYQRVDPVHQMDDSAFTVSNQATSRKIVQSNRTVPSAGQEDMYQQSALLNNRATGQLMKDANFEKKEMSQSHETRREEWKRAQDQPQFLHKNNRCLHCADDHQARDCPMRQQHQAPTTSNPASGTDIYQNTSQFSNTSPPHSSHSQQHSQQSQSTVGITTPTLTVIKPRFPQSFQHPPLAPVPQVSQQTNYQVRPQQFNQQFSQPPLPQVSPLLMPPQPFNQQVPPPYFPQ